MNVLSLFDGMSCGRLALDRLGIKVDKYYASEIDKYAIEVSSANYPDTIQIGDVCDVKGEDYPDIDLILAGSPCQGFSFAGHQLAFDDPRSALFFEFVRVLKEVNPKYFLLENVKMKKEFLDIISDQVGVEPILINSSLLSAQNRQRYYWTNIPGVEQPEDRGLVLKDILETEADEQPTKDTERNRRHHKTPEQKSLTMTATMYKGAGNNGMTLVPMVDKIPDKSETIKSQYYKSSKANFERKGTFHATGVPLDKPKRVGTADIKGHDIKKRVYSGEGKSPSIIADSGTVPKIETKPKRVGTATEQVKVRKHEVEVKKLQRLLRSAKAEVKKTNKQIATETDLPITKVEHWFRTDNSFAIPSDDVWYKLKDVLAITDDTFDAQIMEFDIRDGVYESTQRVYGDEGKSPTLTATHSDKLIRVGTAVDIKGHDSIKRVYSPEGKSPTLTTMQGGHRQPKVAVETSENGVTNIKKGTSGKSWFFEQQTYTEDSKKTRALKAGSGSGNIPKVISTIRDKSKAVRTGGRGSYDRHEWDSVDEMHWRKLTPLECERLQTVPDNYTNHVSNTQRYKMLGNGWTIEVIVHILSNMEAK